MRADFPEHQQIVADVVSELPDVETLARPLVQAILNLSDAMRSAEWLSDATASLTDVQKLVDLVEGVASYAECVVDNCTMERQLAVAMREIVLSVTGGNHVRTSLHRNHLTREWDFIAVE